MINEVGSGVKASRQRFDGDGKVCQIKERDSGYLSSDSMEQMTCSANESVPLIGSGACVGLTWSVRAASSQRIDRRKSQLIINKGPQLISWSVGDICI
jgi:hypothetical protein